MTKSTTKEHLISVGITFLSVFLTSVGAALATGATENYTVAVVISMILAAVRAGVKAGFEAYFAG